MKMMNKVLTMIVAASSLMLFSCDDEDEVATPAAGDTTSTSTVSFTNLDDFAADAKYEYEGWLLIDGAPVSTGKFKKASDASFTFNKAMAAKATKYILTVEPTEGDVAAPSELKVLAGDITNGTATITTAVGPALGVTFDASTTSGKYITKAPTAANQAGFETSGVWFLDGSADPAVAGLKLPELGKDFVYEGWVVSNGVALSTGTFTSVTGADAASPFSDGGPAFPGEDFVTGAPTGVVFPLKVEELNVVISVEPAKDLDPAPFFLKPLVRGDLASGTLGLGKIPTGTITIK